MMRRVVVYFLYLLAPLFVSCSKWACPPKTGQACVEPGGAVFILDTTSYMTKTDIANQFTYVRSDIFPFLPTYNISIALMSYGTGNTNTNPFTNEVNEACVMLDTLQNANIEQGSYKTSLVDVLKVYKALYHDDDRTLYDGSPFPVFLFSASTDLKDIQLASNYAKRFLPDVQFNLIAIGDAEAAFENNFPYAILYSFDYLMTKVDFHVCLKALMCGYLKQCDAQASTAFFTVMVVTDSVTTTEVVTTPTTRAMDTTPSSTSRPTLPPTTKAATTPVPTITNSTGACECDPAKVWNDVIYLVESSDASGRKNLEDIWTYIQSISTYYNIQKSNYSATDNYMRVGIILYSDDAHLVAPLGTLDYNDIFNMELPYISGAKDGPNIAAGILMAYNQFSENYERPNTKKVIVLIGSTYNHDNKDSPQKVMDEFHEDSGISIVLNYIPVNGFPAPFFEQLASPGYFLNSEVNTVADMLQAQCDANCFCRNNFHYIPKGTRKLPTHGCLMGVDLQGNYALAERNCRNNYYGAHFPIVDSEEIDLFLSNMTLQSYYIGLSLKSDGTWRWDDGTPLGSYRPWVVPATTDSRDGACAIALKGGRTGWAQTNCRNAYEYVCEGTPCSSTNYCSTIN